MVPGEQWHFDEERGTGLTGPQPRRRLGDGLRSRIRAAIAASGGAVFVTPGIRSSYDEWRRIITHAGLPTGDRREPMAPERYEYRTIALIGVPTEDGRTIADLRLGPVPGVVTFPYPAFAEGHPAHGQPVWLRLTGNRVEALVNPEWPPLTLAIISETEGATGKGWVFNGCRPTSLGPGRNPWPELR